MSYDRMSARRPLRVVTNSELKCFRRCHREHRYAYGLGIRAASEPEALRFGSLIHLGLELYWQLLKARDPMPLAPALDLIASRAVDPYESARATALLLGYDARWPREYEVLDVELQFRSELVNPRTGHRSQTFELAGKIDALVREPGTDRVLIVEHKTSSEDLGPGSTYWQRLQLDAQVSVYYAGAKSLGHDVAGCVYDVLARPKLQPYKATPVENRKYTKDGRLYANLREHDETPDDFRLRLGEHIIENPDRYYHRGTVVRLEAEEREAAFDVWQTSRLIRENELIERYPRNPDSCMRYGRACTYFPVCTGTAHLGDPAFFRTVDNPHQELSFE